MDSFEGKNIWLLGASSGIGYSLALELGRRGANLVLSARSRDKLDALNAAMSHRHSVVDFDVADAEKMAAVVDEIKKKFKRCTALFF